MAKPDDADPEDVAVLGPDVGPGRLALRHRNGGIECGLVRPVRDGELLPLRGELVTLTPREDGAFDVRTITKGPAKVSSPAFRAGWGRVFSSNSKKALLNSTRKDESMDDTEIQCRDCTEPFVFTAGEQSFFAEKGFTPPVRCKPCRDKRKAQRENGGGGGPRRDGGGGNHQAYRAVEPPAELPPVEQRRGKGRSRRGRHDNDDSGGGDRW